MQTRSGKSPYEAPITILLVPGEAFHVHTRNGNKGRARYWPSTTIQVGAARVIRAADSMAYQRERGIVAEYGPFPWRKRGRAK